MLYYNNLGQLLSFNLRNGFYIHVSALYSKDDDTYDCTYYFSDKSRLFYLTIDKDAISSERNELFKTLAIHVEEKFLSDDAKDKLDEHIRLYKYALSCMAYGNDYFDSLENNEVDNLDNFEK